MYCGIRVSPVPCLGQRPVSPEVRSVPRVCAFTRWVSDICLQDSHHCTACRAELLGYPGGAGRPVDVLQLPDGSLLVSDDTAKAVYRISYSGPATPAKVKSSGAASAEGTAEASDEFAIANPAGLDNPLLQGPGGITSRANVPKLYAGGSG